MIFAWLLQAALSWLGIGVITVALVAGAIAARYFGLPKWVPLALFVAAGAHAYSGAIYQSGVSTCEASTKAAFDAGVAKQAKANADANDYQRGLVAGLLLGQRDLTATLKENDDEAAVDPAAGNCGLSLGGVQRYEKLRLRSH